MNSSDFNPISHAAGENRPDGFEREEWLEPGKVYAVTLDVGPISNRFLPGHRIRIDVSSSNYPQFDPNTNTAEPLGRERKRQIAQQSVYHDGARASHVLLPLARSRSRWSRSSTACRTGCCSSCLPRE